MFRVSRDDFFVTLCVTPDHECICVKVTFIFESGEQPDKADKTAAPPAAPKAKAAPAKADVPPPHAVYGKVQERMGD